MENCLNGSILGQFWVEDDLEMHDSDKDRRSFRDDDVFIFNYIEKRI